MVAGLRRAFCPSRDASRGGIAVLLILACSLNSLATIQAQEQERYTGYIKTGADVSLKLR